MTLKDWIRFPFDFRHAQALLSSERSGAIGLNERPIVLDLATTDFCFDCGRHLAALAQQSIAIGSPFLLRCPSSVLAVIARKQHGREMLALSNAAYLTPTEPLPANCLRLTDHDSGDATAIWLRVGCEPEPGMPVMPYPMHPATLDHWPPTNLDSLRGDRQRDHRVFFAGNQKPKYGQGKLSQQFGIMDRIEVIRAIRDQFPFADPEFICLKDSRESSITAEDWLPTIATADFFLCAPGSSQPTCHHLVESMAVGTVPILEYDDRVTPRLVDGETAITFRGREGLIAAIDRVLRMPKDEIANLRTNAAAFFDAHLCQGRFLKGIRDGKFDLPTRSISMPFHNQDFYTSEAGSSSSQQQAA
ncbi:hypothetical protein LF1_50960 [Rubripirellula obstinata]|uniref:Exostosin family protein n=1 Tax=Rubripirellula obstinata TaxID=406547 RepID=A0A5B1CS74_9BACT|nr:glycosyltransferase [Rubripirellula obstinata]KAA1262530.1 hypothetical protein LF1_50960 [Rubripirellula obstinata]